MGFPSSFRISGSALTAQRLRMDVIANNIANSETTRTPTGEAYRRERVVFRPWVQSTPLTAYSSIHEAMQRQAFQQASAGLQVSAVSKDPSPFRRVYDPGHPDADAEGFVDYPNVDVVTEMTDMLSATRAYEANVTALNALKTMAQRALEIGRS